MAVGLLEPVEQFGFDTPYAERTSATLEVDGAASLDHVYRQAIAVLRPQAVTGGPGYVEDPYEVVRWVWFYEPADDGGIPQTKVYEVAEDIIVVEADGTARWNLTAEQITVDHLLRSADRGLLRGDPLRPYLVLLLPQGGDAFQTAWEVALAAWQVVTNLLAAHDLYTLLRGARREEIQQDLEDGTDVVDRYRARWSTAGGGPSELLRTMERRPWSVADLRALLGVATDDDARKLLRLFGFEPNADGDYVLSEGQELRLLHTIGQEASLGGFDVADDPERAKRRLATTLEPGELPPRVNLDDFTDFMEDDLGAPIARRRLAGPPGASRQHAGDPLTRARVLTITDRCWCCRSKVRAVVGVLVEMSAGQRLVAFAEIAAAFASAADPSALAARGIGPLRHRDSPGIPGGYISNGCLECDTLIGRLALDDMLDEHLRNGGTYGQLDCGLALELELEIPTAAIGLRRGP